MARSFQNIELFKGMTVLDNLMLGRHIHMKTGLLTGGLFFGPARREEIRNREVVEEIVDFLEIQAIRKKVVGTLAYGLQKRVELGRALALEPRLLLLDEPMAGMNAEETEDMARFILDINEERGITIVLIEHDMGVVMDISDRICASTSASSSPRGRRPRSRPTRRSSAPTSARPTSCSTSREATTMASATRRSPRSPRS